MSNPTGDPGNADQIAYWNGPGGRSWVNRQELQEASLAPISDALIERAAVRPGERVVDIGCGTGATTIELGRLVGSSGRVLGIDVSEPMLARAVRRLTPDSHVSFVQTDATIHEFRQADFDLLFSRFGVMFFAEPARTFANLRAALRPGGRLIFACWRKPDENSWLTVPLRAALAHVPPLPKVGPEDPGMFSFAREERVERILDEAGFQSIRLEPRDFAFDIGRGRGLDEAVAAAVSIGPASRALDGQPDEIRRAVEASIRRALTPYQRGATIPLPAAIWLVSATRP